MLESKLTRKEERIYFAGFFDGEGYVGIQRCSSKTAKKGYRNILVVSLTNTNPKPVNLACKIYGGRIDQYTPKKGKKLAYQWRIWSKKAAVFLLDVLPYTLVKKEQVEIALSFQRSLNRHQTPKTEERLAIEEAQKVLIRSFNCKRREVN